VDEPAKDNIDERDEQPARKSPQDARLLGMMRELSLVCPHCGYDMHGAVSVTCPECGVHIREEDYRVANSRRPLPNSKWLVMCIVGATCGIVIAPVLATMLTKELSRASTAWPFGLSFFIVAGSLAAMCWLTWWLAYRPLRALAMPFGLRMLLGCGLGLIAMAAVGGVLAGAAWMLWIAWQFFP